MRFDFFQFDAEKRQIHLFAHSIISSVCELFYHSLHTVLPLQNVHKITAARFGRR